MGVGSWPSFREKVYFRSPSIHQVSDGINHLMYYHMVNIIHCVLDEQKVEPIKYILSHFLCVSQEIAIGPEAGSVRQI